MSLLLLRDAEVFDPASRGRCDILCGGGKVLAIESRIFAAGELPGGLEVEEVDLAGAIVTPGLVDAHVHLTGGGGEAGYASRVPPLQLTALTLAGVTSVVGVLGTDGCGRTMRELVASTLAMREQGLSAWCWTGNYEVPVKTLTGSVRDDMMFVDPIIGVGELAISDHRSSQPTLDELLRVAADVHVGGLMTGKAGVLHLHLGDGARGLELVRAALRHSELPARVFHPTHVNRNPALFEEALALARPGDASAPFVDLTAFADGDIDDGLSAASGIARWLEAGLPLDRLTCSSDGGGCMPRFDAEGTAVGYGVGSPGTLLETLRAAVGEHGLGLDQVLPVLTRNPAGLLRLPGKGRLAPGMDADLLVLGPRPGLALRGAIAGGRWVVREGQAAVPDAFG